MAVTTTTNSSAIALTDVSIVVASATGFSAGRLVKVNGEFMQVAQNYTSGTTIPVLRGRQGTAQTAHGVTSNVEVGTGEDFAQGAAQAVVAYPYIRSRIVKAYGAAGAITLPTPGSDMVAILIGTSALAMTVAAPTKDMDGCRLVIQGNAKSASTITVTNGIGNAGSSYDVVTLQNAGNVGIELIAVNAFWNINAAPAITGTTTAIGAAIA